MAPKGPKMAPREPKMAPTGPKTPPHQRSSPICGPLGPPKGPPEPLKLDTWDPKRVTTSIGILHFFTFEAMSKRGSRELVTKPDIDVSNLLNEDQVCIFNHGKFYDAYKSYVLFSKWG